MQPFRFSLDRVLAWRRTQLGLEEARFRQEMAAMAGIDRLRAEAEAAGVKAEMNVRGWRTVTGAELAALGEFRRAIQARKAEIAARRVRQVQKIAAQEAALMEARRRCRLLERLKEKRAGEWRSASDRELEEVASESYLAQWTRRATPNS
ncbi:MAG: hypothetical protein LAQ30_14405 [Acidobacteriia bacterium]|nr:hypothetical protein [Terriglobia bacterium]